MLNQITGGAMRGLTLLAKFFLVMFIAKLFSPTELGIYGLIFSSIAYAMGPLGMEFYTYSIREIVKSVPENRFSKIRDHFTVFIFSYIIIIPIFLVLFLLKYLPQKYMYIFFFLLLCEHLYLEFYRILIGLNRPVVANMLLFFGSGLWIYILIPAIYLNYIHPSLENVFLFWFFGAFISTITGLVVILISQKNYSLQRVNWSWIIYGFRVALPFLIATFASRAMFTFDRYLLNSFSKLDVVGAYILYMGLATAMLSFIESAIFVFSYPRLINSVNDRNKFVFFSEVRKIIIQASVFCILFSIGILFFTTYLVAWLDKPIYNNYLYFLPYSLLAIIILVFATIFKHCLYAFEKDLHIVLSQVTAFFIFLSVYYILLYKLNELAILIGLIFGFSSSLLWWAILFFRVHRKHFVSEVN